MGNLWDAEIAISSENALRLIQKTFPEIRAKSICELGIGWDNSAFLIDETYVFRFPRRKCAIPLLQREHLTLPILQESVSISIPNPVYFSSGSDGFPYPFLGYQLLPGKMACRCDLSEEDRARMANDLALFLKQIHATSLTQVKGCELPFDELERLNSKYLIDRLQVSLKNIKNLGYIEDFSCYNPILNKTYDKKLLQNTVVHGDVHVKHLLVKKSKLAGVIDFGDIHIGDIAVDLAIAHSFLPQKAHVIFRKTYGHIEDKTWGLARLRALYGASIIVEYSHDRNDQDFLREALYTLRLFRVS